MSGLPALPRCFCHVHISLNKVGILLESNMKFSFCTSFTSLGSVFFFQIALCMRFQFLNSLPEILQTTFATGANPSSASLCWQRGLYGLSYGTQRGLYGLSYGTRQVAFQLKKPNCCVTKVT